MEPSLWRGPIWRDERLLREFRLSGRWSAHRDYVHLGGEPIAARTYNPSDVHHFHWITWGRRAW